jgi:hypothetical protein
MLHTAVLVAAAGLITLVPGTGAPGTGGSVAGRPVVVAPSAAKVPKFSCGYENTVTATDTNGSMIPTARKAGTKLDDTLHVRNVESAALPGAYYTFDVVDAYKGHGGTPTVWWRIGSGHWKLMTLHWSTKTTSTELAGWQSPNLALGTIPAHGTIAVEVSLSFPAHSIKGSYGDMFRFGSSACDASFPNQGWFTSSGFEYDPPKGLEGTPQ